MDHLWLYFIVVFGIIALPGLDMAYVMGNAMLGGRRAGFAAVAGIVAGGFCHLLMGALGVAIILQWWPALFKVILVAGALYIAWMGVTLMRSSAIFRPEHGSGVLAPQVIFRRAMLTSLLNPKAYVFMLAIFPQFLRAGAGPLWLQSGVLGAITAATQAAVYGALALAAAQATHWFGRNPAAATLTSRILGALLLLTAALGLLQAVR